MDKKINVKKGEYEIVDGRVIITSDELAKAISDQELNLSAEDEADASVLEVNIGNCGRC